MLEDHHHCQCGRDPALCRAEDYHNCQCGRDPALCRVTYGNAWHNAYTTRKLEQLTNTIYKCVVTTTKDLAALMAEYALKI
jgi:hypothetical protein